MNECLVVKLGFQMFDMLHTYGLAIVLAEAGQTPIAISDEGAAFRLAGSFTSLPDQLTLQNILPIPTPDEFLPLTELPRLTEYPDNCFANFDGLLSALFTIPGVRAVSVQDLCTKTKPTIAEDAHKKVSRAITRWQQYLDKNMPSPGKHWLQELLIDYNPINPVTPYPAVARKTDTSVLMTIDPAFGFSCTQTLSDGLVTNRTNTAIRGTRYAVILANIGASRFLRAYRVAGTLVNFVVPVFKHTVVESQTHLPPEPHTQASATPSLIAQALAKAEAYFQSDFEFTGLVYQVLQTQGASQSISVMRGVYDVQWVAAIERPDWPSVARYWRGLLSKPVKEWPFEADYLVDALLNQTSQAWLNHFYDIALNIQAHQGANGEPSSAEKKQVGKIRQYHLLEMEGIITQMDNPPPALSQVIAYETGTLKFGRSLRLLGKQNKGAIRDIFDSLTNVKTVDQLLRVLAAAFQECLLTSAHSEFVLVPNDDDLQLLLADVDQFGPKQVASLLLILSTLRYPSTSPQPSTHRNLNKKLRRRPVYGQRKSNHYLRTITKRSHHVASTQFEQCGEQWL